MVSKKVLITTDSGEKVEAVAPVVLSASRATDIPAFYAKWLVERFRRGYIVWVNPFNQKPMYISLSEVRAIVFWTKNPRPLMPLLHEFDNRGIHYYFQYTLNDYGQERLEPSVPPLERRIATFCELSQQIGPERVIWRYDPIMVLPSLTVADTLERIERLGKRLRGATEKMVYSFVDIKTYRKVQNNLAKDIALFSGGDVVSAEPSEMQMIQITEGLCRLRDTWAGQGWELSLATCSEAIDLSQFGVEHNRCIDAELLKRIASHDTDFVYYLNYGEFPNHEDLFSSEPTVVLTPKQLKDKGQRKTCGCMVSKDIGMYNTCPHFCVYCYANTSPSLVMKNIKKHQETGEGLV